MGRTLEDILRSCQLFAEVDDQRRQRLAALSLIREFSKGQSIFRQLSLRCHLKLIGGPFELVEQNNGFLILPAFQELVCPFELLPFKLLLPTGFFFLQTNCLLSDESLFFDYRKRVSLSGIRPLKGDQ